MLSKKATVLTSLTALGAALLVLTPIAVRSQDGCPCSWYEAVPDPAWGLPGTLGDLLPAQYYDMEMVIANFAVPVDGLQSLLPPQLEAIEAIPGYGLLGAYFAEYNSLANFAPYNEEILCIMVYDPIEGFPAWFTISITVTTPAAQWAGIVGYGLPKVLGSVHIQSVKPKGVKCHASADSGLIMKLEVPTDDMVPDQAGTIWNVSIKDGCFVRFPYVQTGTCYRSDSFGRCTIKLGNDPVARQLRAIGVEECPSIGAFYGVHLQGTLYAGSCSPLP